ncbi:DUF6115 domain-containing protein [Paenibacillus aceti]|uniref:DUF2802 domain-containing protein n=1 Tax=Paenibacillus aceti TaxID=1820010 RepID=A0ABQ1VV52_9BACL|nr:hypothetical protein [Paenibacillus aceti]GGF97018.1 hypothetical protein GCM10010913_18270 [Paenibacillus aceti]
MSLSDPWFYIVLLGLAALVYALFLPERKSAAQAKAGANHELEATLEHFMSDIEQENNELIELVSQMKQDFVSKQLAQQEQIAELRQRVIGIEQSAREFHPSTGQVDVPASSAEAPPAAPVQTLPAEDVQVQWDDAANEAAVAQELAPESEPIVEVEPEPEVSETVRDRYPQLFELYARGKSMDSIAKSLGIPRGEVQLILQLAKREEA